MEECFADSFSSSRNDFISSKQSFLFFNISHPFIIKWSARWANNHEMSQLGKGDITHILKYQEQGPIIWNDFSEIREPYTYNGNHESTKSIHPRLLVSVPFFHQCFNSTKHSSGVGKCNCVSHQHSWVQYLSPTPNYTLLLVQEWWLHTGLCYSLGSFWLWA